ncbi:MAG TPA: C40 family peptidase [Chitinophagales bacterium]|nr:C40 family peptidase [Chitinophagales bacterium]HMW12249.1 C40 family peptidase [Chitinophagales bacterium]HMX59862.1 C40 family peptidase [Chitinophagales bacterium]HMY23301.1 C40 family peptidase [Chitinophagales bacterium]HMZ33170.1 C40 family peptidase [Chitinophagales bacterium]
MKKLTIIFLFTITLFSQQKSYAAGGFCSMLDKICMQKKIDADAFSNFFQKININISKASDLGMYANIFKWLYTPYRYGGKTERGIDCSNYVFKLMDDCSDTYATSKQLADITDYVDREELKEGDLIFFNMKGYGISHVGVYLQDGKFTHSSSSKGVTISSLDEPYWNTRYCRAGRINSK